MQKAIQTTKTVFSVSQFLDWQRQGTLDLSPIFQRRPVWRRPAKSQLIDSLVRGFPIPIILLRQVQDLDTLSMKMEVVDGQQRLRTLLAYIDPSCLGDFDEETDAVAVQRTHNSQISGKPFASLPIEIKNHLLGYELSTHIFPATTGDELVFRIFALLNSTGLSLNKQEIRNSEFHGAFKTLVYDLSFENLDYWRKWKIFSTNSIARMDEAEAVSEYLLTMSNGVTGTNQNNISKLYEMYEDNFPKSGLVHQRFTRTMTTIDQAVGDRIAHSTFSRAALFYSLVSAIYHHMYGLGSPMTKVKPRKLPKDIPLSFEEASRRIRVRDLPERVQDAMDKATGDKARRDQRHNFIMDNLRLEPTN